MGREVGLRTKGGGRGGNSTLFASEWKTLGRDGLWNATLTSLGCSYIQVRLIVSCHCGGARNIFDYMHVKSLLQKRWNMGESEESLMLYCFKRIIPPLTLQLKEITYRPDTKERTAPVTINMAAFAWKRKITQTPLIT